MPLQLIGDTRVFAVEFEVLPMRVDRRHYGTCGVWINGFLVQERDGRNRACEYDVDNTAVILTGLARAPASDPPPNALYGIQTAEELANLCSNEEIGQTLEEHFFLNGEGFDDFLSLAFKEPQFTTFYSTFHPFRVKNRDGFDEIYSDVSRDLHIAKIQNDFIQQVAEEFEAVLSETPISCDLAALKVRSRF